MRIFTFIVAFLTICNVWAQRFKSGDLYYKVTDEIDKTVEVTYETEFGSNYQDISGRITIPRSVSYENQTYWVTSIGEDAFYACSSITSIIIPESVRSIGNWAFSNCSSLISITIPSSVITIEHSAFSGCSSLTSITIPSSVTSIGDEAFSGCSSLTLIIIPSSVTSIGYRAFSNCSSLISITIPSSVTSIGGLAFSNCSSLTSITIPSSVTRIWDSAFSGCSSLTSITIPSSVTSIGEDAFSGCSSLSSIYVDSANPVYSSNEDRVLFNKDKTELIAYPVGKKEESYTIPSSVTRIWDSAFSGCSSLTSITVPSSVTSIGVGAFSSCSGLTSITISESVTSIGDEAFSNCSSLISITIPSSVTSIGNWAFYNCSGLTSITIPSSVRSIGNWAFYNCSSLISITIPSGVTSIGGYAFSGCSSLTSIYADSANPVYSSNEDRVLFNKDKTELIAYPVGRNEESYTIPSSVNIIGPTAFSYCSGLTSITIPSSVTSIGNWAFSHCSGLTSITIPSSVTSIGDGAFSYCSQFESMIVEAVEPPVVGFSLGFISGTDDVYVYVPEGSLALYQASFSWKDLNLQTFQPEETISGELLVRNIGANITRLDDISGKTFALYNVGRASYVYLGEDGDHQGLYVMSDNPQNRNTFIFTIEKTVDGKYKFKDVNNRYIPSLDDCGNISPSEDAGQFEITSLNDKWIIKDPSNNFYFNGNENGSTFNGWSNGTEANSQYEIRAVDAVVLPLEVSIIGESFDENTKWYRLKAGSSYVRYSKDDTSQIPAAGETPNGFDSYLWSFAKDVTGRYMIYNKAAGADKVMTSLPAEQNDVAVHFADKSTLGTDKNLTWDMYYSDAYSDRTGFRLGRKDDYTRSVSEQGGVLKFSGEKNELSTLEIEAVENPSLYLSTNNFYSFKSQATGKYISSEPNGTDEHLMVDEGNSLEKTSFYITDDFQLIGNTSQNMQGGTTPTSGADIYTFTPQPNGETFYIKPFSTGYLSASESTAVGYSNSRGKGCNWIIEPVNTDELKTSIRNAYPMMENTVGSWKPEAYKSFSQALESQEAGQIVEALRIANTPENLVTFSPSNFYRIMTSPKEDGWNGVVRYLTSTAGRLYGYDSDEQSASQIWKINEEEGSTYTLASQGVYSVAPVGTGTDVTSTEDKAAACRFTMEKRDGHITYGFKNGDMFLHLKKATINSDKTINGYDVEEDACFWYLIETKTIGLTISSSGYATINYPFAVEIPEGLTAYTGIASMNGGAGVFYMTEVSDGLIPANTPVILKGDPGEHTLTIITEDIPELTQESDLHGVLLSEVIPIDINAYVLDNIAEESNDFGFYKLEQGQRILGNNKAYMVPSFDNPANIKSFSIVFDDGPTTGIEDSATADTTQEEFYDLQGRRVLNPTKGIYVTRSGKKVIF